MSDNISPLVMIPVTRIDPHPHNPRRDLGDLGDLVKSIKAQGIRQNLLVVERPRACRVCGCTNDDPCEVEGSLDGCWAIQHDLCSQCEDRAEEVEEDTPWYTVVIGHRRLAAAVQAGLTEVPASIADLTDAQQLELMLVENVQRTDLTPIEEAEGLQGLLDLGVTQAGITKATGISAKTVKGRLQLLTLPETAQAKIHAGQGTLADAVALEAFADDPETQEKLAGLLGSVDFGYKMQVALDKRKSAAKAAAIGEALVARGAVESAGVHGRYVGYVDNVTDAEKINLPDGALFVLSSGYVYLYGPAVASEADDDFAAERAAADAKREAERSARDALWLQYQAAFAVRDQWVKEFAKSAKPTTKEVTAIVAAAGAYLPLHETRRSPLAAWLGLKDGDQYTTSKVDKAITKWIPTVAPASVLLVMMHVTVDREITPDHRPVFEALEACGYTPSTIERSWYTEAPGDA